MLINPLTDDVIYHSCTKTTVTMHNNLPAKTPFYKSFSTSVLTYKIFYTLLDFVNVIHSDLIEKADRTDGAL